MYRGDYEDDYTTLSTKMESLERAVDSLDRLIRGHDGVPGLLTRLALLENAINSRNGRFVTWAWLLDKALMPVVVAIIVALITCWQLGGF